MTHDLWRRVRRPFRYPRCQQCVWEVYDAHLAGCLRCGRCHMCQSNAVDSTCRLILCDDASRACDITGFVLPEVRHAVSEYTDTSVHHTAAPLSTDIHPEVHGIVCMFLLGPRAKRCRDLENRRLYARLAQGLYKTLKAFKLEQPRAAPNVCHMLAAAIGRERNWQFLEEPGEELLSRSSQAIARCLLDLRSKGVKIASPHRMQELVCGLLFMLKPGLIFGNRVLLPAIPELQRCLPPENKLQSFLGVSSKIICMTENEVKMIFREHYQK
jgi:hypothetical protein